MTIPASIGASSRAMARSSADYGAELPVMLDCPVRGIDHGGKRLRIETGQGRDRGRSGHRDGAERGAGGGADSCSRPRCRQKSKPRAACRWGLPTSCSWRSTVPRSSTTKSAGVRPHRPRRHRAAIISGRSAGRRSRPISAARFAAELEAQGERAFFDFAVSELVGICSAAILPPPQADPDASLGPRSVCARVLFVAPCRDWRIAAQTLAEPVDDRLFFAGEACSTNDFSTAHGGWLTGVAAADSAIAAR